MGGRSPTPFVNAFHAPKLNSLRYNVSQQGSPLFVVYGTMRCTINLLEFWGFHGSSAGAKGGKGLGGSGGKKGSNQNYSVNVAFAFCQGPAGFRGASHGTGGPSGWNRVWANGGVAFANAVNLNGYTGNDGQAPDPVFLSSDPNTPVLGYSGITYVTGTPLQLGSSPVLPNIQAEVTGFLAGTGGPNFPDDANPSGIVVDLLTSTRTGAGFPSANLDIAGSLADFATYCQAGQMLMSVVMDRQQPAARWLEDITTLTSCAVVWSGSKLKIIPYGDSQLSANGAVWTPNLQWRYALTDTDFIRMGGRTDPVLLMQTDPTLLPNWLTIEYMDSVNGYNPVVIPVFDQGLIDRYGLRMSSSQQGHMFTNPTSATLSAQLSLQRQSYVRNRFKFKLGWRFSLLEPMDIVLLTDQTLGIVNAPVRVTGVDEDDNGELTVTAEEIPGSASVTLPNIIPQGVGVADQYFTQSSTGNGLDFLVNPGDTNAPIVFEPPSALTDTNREVWLVATGASENWGGCQVWLSLDGTSYTLLGTVFRGARQGLLTGPLPSSVDPDVVHTLGVDLTMSMGQLLSGTQNDADNFVTLCYVDGELVSYQTATLSSAFHYNLTYLRRGAYGSAVLSHSAGTQFARIGPNDPSVFKFNYPENYVGQQVFFKLPSFNIFGLSIQSLADIGPANYTFNGTGAAVFPYEMFGSQSGLTLGGLIIFRWAFSNIVSFVGGFTAARARARVAATNTTTYNVQLNGIPIGTMTFNSGQTDAVFTPNTNFAFASGHVVTIAAPGTPDATLTDIAWSFLGYTSDVGTTELHGAQSGATVANLIIEHFTTVNSITFPTNMTNSYVISDFAATGTVSYTFKKNGVSFGTMTFTPGTTIPTFAVTSTTFNAGDVLIVQGPGTPDATLRGLQWSFRAQDNVAPFPLAYGSASGPIMANLVIFRRMFGRTMTFFADFANSHGDILTPAASISTVFNIQRNGATIGTMTCNVGATTPAFLTGGVSVTFNAGDVMTIVAPASPDVFLRDMSWSLAAL